LETRNSDGSSLLWVGTADAGLARLQNGTWTTFDIKSGLVSNKVLSLRETKSLDGSRTLWVGANGGVARLNLDSKKAEWITFSDAIKPVLPNNFIGQILEDAKHRIFLFTVKGIVRLTPRIATPDDAAEYSIYTFTIDDGLPSNECNDASSMIDSRGRIWAGTVEGAAMFDPSLETADHTAKPLYIEKMLLAGKERGLANAALGYNENNIAFEYALLSYFRESDTRYRTQLMGIDNEPSDWVSDYKKEYLALPEGSYIFKVWGKDYAGNETGPIEIPFRVLPPWWRTWWAYLLYFGAFAGIGYGGVRFRLQMLEQRNRMLEARIVERTNELANKNAELSGALEQVKLSKQEVEKKVEELIESHQRADRIFSALAEALPGTILDEKYRIDEKIGAGGFGAVYRGTHLAMKRAIAIKVFKPMPGNDSAEGLQRFQLEAVSAARVNHPNAVAVLDSGISSEGIAYLVMELLSGHSLKDELREKGSLSLKRCAAIIIPVCDVISKAHAAGILHRDIKPDNIFLNQTPEGEVIKVVDFGIAKLMDDSLSLDMKNLTATGGFIGTPTYMAPERFENRPYDGKSDVYSIGIMLYEMLCGRAPFLAKQSEFFAVIMQHLNTAPPPLRESNPNISDEVEKIALQAISKDPRQRPAAKELAEMFAKAANVEIATIMNTVKAGIIAESIIETATLKFDHMQKQTSDGRNSTNEMMEARDNTEPATIIKQKIEET
jgi:serine/threonine protein kinase